MRAVERPIEEIVSTTIEVLRNRLANPDAPPVRLQLPYRIVGRVSENGPILDAAAITSVTYDTSAETHFTVVQEFRDGSHLVDFWCDEDAVSNIRWIKVRVG